MNTLIVLLLIFLVTAIIVAAFYNGVLKKAKPIFEKPEEEIYQDYVDHIVNKHESTQTNGLPVTTETVAIQARTYTKNEFAMLNQLDGLLGIIAGEDVEPFFVVAVDHLAKAGYKFVGTGTEIVDILKGSKI